MDPRFYSRFHDSVYEGLMHEPTWVRNVFDESAHGRIADSISPAALDTRVLFDDRLGDRSVAVGRIRPGLSGEDRFGIRVNSRLATDPETLAYHIARAAHQIDVIRRGEAYDRVIHANQARSAAEHIVGYSDPNRPIVVHRPRPSISAGRTPAAPRFTDLN